jgi:hypothetical protein
MNRKTFLQQLRATLIPILFCYLPATSAFADGLYAGVSLGQLTGDFKPVILHGNFGIELNETFSFEGRAGTGLRSDNQGEGVTRRGLKVGSYLGLYTKGNLPISQSVSAYGIVGVTNMNITRRAGGGSRATTENRGSYGLGVNVATGTSSAITVEWLRALNNVEMASVGLQFSF